MNKLFFILCFCFLFLESTNTIEITLIPGGDANQKNRTIGDYFEHGITITICEMIQKEIHLISKKSENKIICIILKDIQKISTPEKRASFINQHAKGVIIHIGCYFQYAQIPKIDIFTSGDTFNKPIIKGFNNDEDIQLTHFDHAFTINQIKSNSIADTFKNSLSIMYRSFYTIELYKSIPFIPLKGVILPSIALELGIQNIKNQWEKMTIDLAGILYEIIKT
jgi:hypothetical protein